MAVKKTQGPVRPHTDLKMHFLKELISLTQIMPESTGIHEAITAEEREPG